MSIHLPSLDADPAAPFPPVEEALREPNGLLAIGGDLSPQRLLRAYRGGIFPWYSRGDPILWWSPDPRAVFETDALHLSRRFRRDMRNRDWSLHVDREFDAVLAACAKVPRRGQAGTWILPSMQAAYALLHRLGHAHSIEVRDASDRLIGGVYGVHVGPVFCGESMFSHESGASKFALAGLCRLLAVRGVRWLDAQMHTPHLAALGVHMISRDDYLQCLDTPTTGSLPSASWSDFTPGGKASDFA